MGKDDVIGIDDVPAAFGHLLPVLPEDHALVVEAEEGLFAGNDPDVMEEFMPKPGVEEVEDRVFGPADIEVDGKPVVEEFFIRDGVGVVGVDVTDVIPAASGPLGHRVGFPLSDPPVVQGYF